MYSEGHSDRKAVSEKKMKYEKKVEALFELTIFIANSQLDEYSGFLYMND